MADPTSARPSVVLASGSPRRRVLLAMIGVEADAVPPDIDESAVASGLDPVEGAVAVALAKIAAVAADGRPTLAADTVVVCDGEILGKPQHRADAERMLRLQMGRTIEVISAIAVRAPHGDVRSTHATSTLTVDEVPENRLQAYLTSGAADDKAGALAVQDAAKDFCHLVTGSRSNVYGLPLAETIELLRSSGVAVTPRPAIGRDLRSEPDGHPL